jgi:hypothetical protein
MPWRSLPAPGSVIAIAVTVSPDTQPGSQRRFCSGVPSETRYGAMMSVCTENPGPEAPDRVCSSDTTWL